MRDSGNRQVLTSQKTLRGGSVAKPSIRLTDAPRGRGRLASFPRHAYADAFNQLAAVGVLNDVAWFYVQSLKSGYVVVVRKAPARALAFALPTHPSGFEPHPGPTLAIRLSNASRVRRRVLTAAIAPARTAAEAEAVAASLLPDK